jgi:CHAT domain
LIHAARESERPGEDEADACHTVDEGSPLSEPLGARPDEAVLQRTGVLVLARGDVLRRLLEERLADGIQARHVAVRELDDASGDAAIVAEEAIELADPSFVLFVGWGLTADRSAVGDVLIADRLLASGAGRIKQAGPRTRRADPLVLRHAHELIAARLSRQEPENGGEQRRSPGVRVGSMAVGSHALQLWNESGGAGFWERFPDTSALDLSGWDFLFGYYGLRALAILGLARESELQMLEVWRRTAAVTAELVARLPPDGPIHAEGPVTNGVATAAEDGEQDHLQSDVTSLAHESTQGMVQRPFVDSARAAHLARSGGRTGTPKGRLESGVIQAFSDDQNVRRYDLKLTVRLRDDRLEFDLDGSGYFDRAVGHVELGGAFEGDPRAYRKWLMNQIRTIAAERHSAQLADLERLGNRLYRDVFPGELKEAYREFRDNSMIQTLLVVSEDPWIPWELIKPYDTAAGTDDDFLCMRFAMSRWLRGSQPLKPKFDVHSVASLEAGSVEGMELLETARAECEYLRQLAQSRSVANLGHDFDCEGYARVQRLLGHEDDVHLWHVAAHGRLGASDPHESAIVFADRPWTSGELIGKTTRGIQRARPLVFLNACLVAQQEFHLARLGGWPSAWIVESQCGGFIAPQWWVDSQLASTFSKAFYDAVVGDEVGKPGKPLAEAVRSARRAVREQEEVDPTWLSYVVYGHPNARVHFQPRPANAG